MNKLLLLSIIGAVFIIAGIGYKLFIASSKPIPIEPPKTVEVSMIIHANTWKFVPNIIEVNEGDRVIAHIMNEDDYDHGFGIDAFGVNKRLWPKQVTTVEFTASPAGEYTFYCSVPCGEGHYEQTGKIVVTPRK